MEQVLKSIDFIDRYNYLWIAKLSPIDFLMNALWDDVRFPRHLKKYLDEFPSFSSIAFENPPGLSIAIGKIPNLFDLDPYTMDEAMNELKIKIKEAIGFETIDEDDIFASEFKRCGPVEYLSQHAMIGMSPKKKHEVSHMAFIIQSIINNCYGDKGKIEQVVELGCGLGYLSSFLALKHPHLSFLGIDLSAHNCLMATERHLRIIKDKSFRKKESSIQKVEFKKVFFSDTVNINEELNCDLQSIWVSLHGCGDLSTSMIRKWSSEENALTLLQVGCCYHRLSLPSNFPLSEMFHGVILLGKEHLNAACQAAPDRTIISTNGQQDNEAMLLHYYGVLFQVLFYFIPTFRFF